MKTGQIVRIDPRTLEPWQRVREVYPDRTDAEWPSFLKDVRERGVMVPLMIANDEVRVICGLQRLRAALETDQETVPAIVMRSMEDDQLFEMAILDNHQRRQDGIIQTARVYAALTELYSGRWGIKHGSVSDTGPHGRTRELIAEQMGVSAMQVERYMALLQLAPAVQAAIDNEELSVTAGLAMRREPLSVQLELLDHVRQHGWGTAQIRQDLERRQLLAIDPSLQNVADDSDRPVPTTPPFSFATDEAAPPVDPNTVPHVRSQSNGHPGVGSTAPNSYRDAVSNGTPHSQNVPPPRAPFVPSADVEDVPYEHYRRDTVRVAWTSEDGTSYSYPLDSLEALPTSLKAELYTVMIDLYTAGAIR